MTAKYMQNLNSHIQARLDFVPACLNESLTKQLVGWSIVDKGKILWFIVCIMKIGVSICVATFL
jgi:hypothetical protein